MEQRSLASSECINAEAIILEGQIKRLQEQLVDLYLSVKIRSNEEIDNYSEELLSKERGKLKDCEAGTLIEYIKTSIEILMNMRLEEYHIIQQ